MIIIAGGDSFVFGSELEDCNSISGSASTFPALLSHDKRFVNVALPGYSNASISRSIINACEKYKNDEIKVMVCWTFSNRYEFRFNYDTNNRESPWYSITPWTIETSLQKIQSEFHAPNHEILLNYVDTLISLQKNGIQSFAKDFYLHVGNNEYYETYTTLKEIVYLQNYLYKKNISYIFTCADNSFWYNSNVDKPDTSLQSLINEVQNNSNNWFWFPPGKKFNETKTPRGFYQWAVENKYPVGTTHPLEEAHAAATELMKEKFNEMVTKSLE